MNHLTLLRCALWVATPLVLGLPSSSASAALGACEGDRYVGLAPNPSACVSPPNSHWQAARLFPSDAPAELAHYCAFTWSDPSPPKLDDLPSTWGTNNNPTLDCAVVAPHSTELSEENQVALETAFRTQVDEVPVLPSPSPPLLVAPPTKVVVVDASQATGFPYPASGLIAHGKMVGTIVRQLACPTGSPICAAAVANTLALPLVRDGDTFRREPTGGRFGSWGDLAVAIHSALSVSAAAPGNNTVINLSVAWDPAWGGAYLAGNWQSLEPPLRAVHSAISLAVCRGALIIASSGNASGGPDESTGAGYPAAWEAKPAPVPARCAALGAPALPLANTTYQRMVYAVGGVDGRDLDLPNARPGSRPPIVAPSDHVTISDGVGQITDVYTGSSVGAAVTSAAASIVWRYRPTTRSHDVMARVRAGSAALLGHPVQIARDLCAGAACPVTAGRTSICGAVLQACAGGVCPAFSCTISPAFRDERPDLTNSLVPPEWSAAGLAHQSPAVAPCEGTYYSSTIISPQQCPADALANHNAKPFSTPQPGGIACPTCPLEVTHAILNLDKTYKGLLSKPTIVIKPFGGDKKIIPLSLDPVSLDNADTIEVTDLPFSSSDTEWATVDFEVNADSGPYSSSSPLIIVKDLP